MDARMTARWTRLSEAARTVGLGPTLTADIAQNFTPAFRASGATAPLESLLRARRLEGYLGCAATIAGTDFYTTTASLRLPCLVIASDQDAITPADMLSELAELIPGARFGVIRRSGHLPMLEQPQAFATALTHFSRSIGQL